MRKTQIEFELTEDSIDDAIKALKKYKKDLQSKCEQMRERVAEKLREKAQTGFDNALLEDIVTVGGGGYNANVIVTTSPGNDNDVTLVIASGEDAVWVEFGAGVYYNGSAGSSPNPYGSSLGFTIGSYGKGNGKKETWGFYKDGELKLTHGTPAARPMFKAVETIMRDIDEIVGEVFG